MTTAGKSFTSCLLVISDGNWAEDVLAFDVDSVNQKQEMKLQPPIPLVHSSVIFPFY